MIENLKKVQDSKTIDFDRPVKVYFNFVKQVWSILQGKVKAHADYVCLSDATFQVSERGRQRTINNRRKTVHAYIKGFVVLQPAKVLYSLDEPWDEVKYNPYFNSTFITNNGVAVKSAKFVDMDASSVVAKVMAKL